MENAIFSCNVLQRKGKYGKLKADENGYKEICLGAFNAYNDVGALYAYTPNVKNLLTGANQFTRQISKGALYGELGHPKRLPGESAEQFLERALTVSETNTCVHIKAIRIEDGKDHKGRPVKLCIGLVKGAGAHQSSLESSLNNPDENVAFSIRCLTRPVRTQTGQIAKELYHPVTWDRVLEGGIDVANKYDTPSMESSNLEIEVTPEMIDSIENSKEHAVSMESLKTAITMVRSNLGWQAVQSIPVHSATNWK